jgi:hypothetical protein
MSICQIDRTSARTWPYGFIYDDYPKGWARFSAETCTISRDRPNRTQRDDFAEGESREGDRRTVVRNVRIYNYWRRRKSDELRIQKISHCLTLCQIEMAVDRAAGEQEREPSEINDSPTIPFVLLESYGDYWTISKVPARRKFVNDMRRSQEYSVFRQKECRANNHSEFCGLIRIAVIAHHRRDGSLYCLNRIHERTTFAGRRGCRSPSTCAEGKQSRKSQEKAPITGTYFGPMYSGQCRRTLRGENLIIQCLNPSTPAD